jgi:CDP-diacylglycerol--glycerol-3-phosphate 3-phosphatidyltransferase
MEPREPLRRQLNLPNAITIARILLVPILVTIILTKFDDKEWFSVSVFLLAASTDWLDGWVARRRKQVTTLGKLLDPMADKLLISGAFISLIEVAHVPSWMVVVIIAREFAVTGLRGIAAERGIAVAASRWGKIKMAMQVTCVCFLLLSHPAASPGPYEEVMFRPFTEGLLWGTVLVTAFSGIDYFIKLRRVLETPVEQDASP